MAAQYITLDEAAKKLGIPTDEFKRRLKTEWTHLVPMRDGPTLRFRENQIEELARQLGAASDPELPLAGMSDSVEHGSDDFKVDPKTAGKAKQADDPLVFDASDDDIFSLSATEPPKGQPKSTSDSASGDSDVRLEVSKMPKKKGPSSEPEAIPTEEIALDAGPSSAVIKGGSSAKLTAPKSSGKLSAGSDVAKSLSKKSTGDSSEFELSLEADSDDFELQLNTDSSDEVDLGSSPVEETGGRAGKSGINLKSPGDSGVSLEKGKKSDSGRNLGKKPDSGKSLNKPAPKSTTDSDSDVDFELSLETEPQSSGRLGKAAGPKSGKIPVTSDSDSEFELTLDDSGEGSSLEAAALEGEESKGDIFETDFEIPPMTDESGSEAVALESDTDIEHEAASDDDVAIEEEVVAEEETGSQVVLLEDDDVPAPKAKGGKKKAAPVVDEEEAVGDVDLADVEDEDSASSALRGVKPRRIDDEEEVEIAATGRAAPLPWGPVPAIILFPSLLVLVLGGIMGFELLHTMVGYQQPSKPAAPLVRGVAKTLDMELKDQ
jgi:hypothetical protein